MTLRLPRLTAKAWVTDPERGPSNTFARQWDQVCTAVENVSPDSVVRSGDVATTGYVTIRLADGTLAKLAVVG